MLQNCPREILKTALESCFHAGFNGESKLPKRAKINYVDFSYTPLGPLIVENRFFGTPQGTLRGRRRLWMLPKLTLILSEKIDISIKKWSQMKEFFLD